MLVLGIESTCDETSCAIVKDGHEILSNIISSQIDIHREYGGVVPELACRRHVDLMIPIIKEALVTAKISLHDIDLISVAMGPGLIGALLLGINTAKSLALSLDIPFVGVNHIEAHLYAAMMEKEIAFPCMGVVLSGGHTCLVKINSIGKYQLIGETLDDAIGEAFDKVAKMLGLPYPGGPEVEKLAKLGNPTRYPFKPGKIKNKPFHFSFSGLKTNVLYTVNGQNSSQKISKNLSQNEKANVAASFQETAFQDVINKTLKTAEYYQIETVVFGGGVTNSQTLRKMFQTASPELNLLWPPPKLSLDNAAMIAGLGYHKFQARGAGDDLSLEAKTRIPF